jgi:hypothetical protein
MKALPVIYGVVTIAALAAAIGIPAVMHERGSAAITTWQGMVEPGPLSSKHAFLARDCEACHTPHLGVTGDRCIACHANNAALLGKQSTAFHADVQECSGCHIEHLTPEAPGVPSRLVTMDHSHLVRAALAGKIGDALPLSVPAGVKLNLLPVQHPRIKPAETALDCNSCHSNQDPHRTTFGTDCASCHATNARDGGWSIAEFRHPSPRSTDCAQCHQAPPSHSMEHFHMVSAVVARQPHADVTQCFLCHQTNAWNDIKGVGWYKHH